MLDAPGAPRDGGIRVLETRRRPGAVKTEAKDAETKSVKVLRPLAKTECDAIVRDDGKGNAKCGSLWGR